MILAHSVSCNGHTCIDSSISLQYIFEPVPLQIVFAMFTNVAPPVLHVTPEGQYILADDGHD